MNGGTVMRNRNMRQLRGVLERQLAGRTCEPIGPDMKIIVEIPLAEIHASPGA